MAEQEQNRSEAPTPFKLRKAREKGMVARSAELGFLGGLVALAGFGAAAGDATLAKLRELMRQSFAVGIDRASESEQLGALVQDLGRATLAPLALLGGTIVAVVIFLEILQLRGVIFTAQPLKPDFNRLNPAQGLKRIFSLRMLKETLKTVLKSACYGIAAWLVIQDSLARFGHAAANGEQLAGAMAGAAFRLIFVFLLIAVAFVILDQVLVRSEFLKQMRMSRREVTRENKDQQGDPRIKQKRKQLHAEFVAQSKGLEALPGSDLLVVNPEHFAVALRYDPKTMLAPEVSAKGRNRFALALKNEAFRLGIPVLERPPLARALFRGCKTGSPVPSTAYEDVAALYIALRRRSSASRTA
ncbi:EscU/YscU/HrcU family type III secretion system export apparatus switch protein [Sphingomonas elodea]|uniref:EscU/YscU/HrcU family type III secretion system export apparatus switch protein n=1 Tax=Sphingomonas elodea TaxID=179878 RepID=UPI000263106D|nr:EscU/YscU/HrcU family type III secretion system export apparatus switch protein [Sphingomonas elodea]